MQIRVIARVFTILAVVGAVTIATFSQVAADQSAVETDPHNYSDLAKIVEDISEVPKIAQPGWLNEQIAAEKDQAVNESATPSSNASSTPAATQQTVTYSVETRGQIQSSTGEFKSLVNQTLHDSRGWAQLGIDFQQVTSGGSFTLVLAQAEEVPKFSSGCSSEWSCRVGSYVIINDDRWSGATAAWNGAGGSLRDYRHYVINHEVGHWLGHDHRSCSGSGQLAPVMQQQSISLQGCRVNSWPLQQERSAPNLGL